MTLVSKEVFKKNETNLFYNIERHDPSLFWNQTGLSSDDDTLILPDFGNKLKRLTHRAARSLLIFYRSNCKHECEKRKSCMSPERCNMRSVRIRTYVCLWYPCMILGEGRKTTNGECWQCGERGHFRAECPEKEDDLDY